MRPFEADASRLMDEEKKDDAFRECREEKVLAR